MERKTTKYFSAECVIPRVVSRQDLKEVNKCCVHLNKSTDRLFPVKYYDMVPENTKLFENQYSVVLLDDITGTAWFAPKESKSTTDIVSILNVFKKGHQK